jgi:hypothetical protein
VKQRVTSAGADVYERDKQAVVQHGQNCKVNGGDYVKK